MVIFSRVARIRRSKQPVPAMLMVWFALMSRPVPAAAPAPFKPYLYAISHLGSLQSAGIADTPDGRAFYRERIEYHTTTTLTPDQIHAIGLTEVKRIRAEMDAIIFSWPCNMRIQRVCR